MDWHPTKDNVLASVGDDKMLMVYVAIYSLAFCMTSNVAHHSWDTRASSEATMKVEAHDREILAVAYNPSVEHLLLTASADKVSCVHTLFHVKFTDPGASRRLYSTTCVYRRNACMCLSPIWTKSYMWHGHPTILPSSRHARAIVGLMSGI